MANSDKHRLHIVFDVSDVANYFRSGRLPTGIQRVQIELVEYALRKKGRDFDFSIVCFTNDTSCWVEISKGLFGELIRASVGTALEAAWDALVERLETLIQRAKRFVFPEGAMLLNLGSSWWLHNYFLGVRLEKTIANIRYVPFIHDFIPIALPELFNKELSDNFVRWIGRIFDHADHFLVNSQSTLRDFSKVSKQMGVERDVAVVTLDADFRDAPSKPKDQLSDDETLDGLAQLGLKPDSFVLFVSTIEPRKNHLMVFSTWLRLIKKYGADRCPKLVCVGQFAWLSDKTRDMLVESPELTRQVLILSDVSDAMLAVLYRNCICTLYPSKYEGWGLPVTESLCFGKVPIVSNVASLPEAGGHYAEYFDLHSEDEFQRAVERLVFDGAYRTAREKKIAAEFRPRTWQSIGAQVIGQLQEWIAKPVTLRTLGQSDSDVRAEQTQWQKIGARIAGQFRALTASASATSEPAVFVRGIYPVRARTGVFYSFAGESENARGRETQDAEIYRNGLNWWWPEPWGAWIKGRGPAQLAFILSEAKGMRFSIYVGLRGLHGKTGKLTVEASAQNRIDVTLAPQEERVVVLGLDAEEASERQVVLSFFGNETADLRVLTRGADYRICGFGVKWFYICREDDMEGRLYVMEMLQMEEAEWFRVPAVSAG